MTSALFFKLIANRITIDTQNTSGIPNPRSVQNHLSDLFFDEWITGFMGVGSNKSSSTVITSIALNTSTGGAIPFDVLSLSAMFARNRF